LRAALGTEHIASGRLYFAIEETEIRGGSLFWLRMGVAAGAAQTQAPKALSVNSSVMEGNLISKKDPVYPAEAKANKDTIDGPVVLSVVISKEGIPERVSVKQSLRADYDRSAIDAVKEWRWKPFLLNGNPIEVKTTVTVNYTLAD
jgi:TonB family protein